MPELQDLRIGQKVRGVFLDDEKYTIEGMKNDLYGTTTEFEGVIKGIDTRSYGGPYVIVTCPEQRTVFMCDLAEIIEVLDNGPWYA